MGACQSMQDSEEEEKRKRSRAIDARLEEDSRRLRRECKILLLGECGALLIAGIAIADHTDVLRVG